ncbi:Holliday junction branch migration protein RuvA [Glaciecola sp. XM2]|jgi:Holliday junction DNA helicase RuvA|uniref:Holliday junction branch migration protein RuvA n=1 Tax=Glaciecola sp. XM2 TaxID=1914931 RepID=UPI001BDEFBB1|nr:Holliday junction branch migration protein RuvA [Glaciecola sp. XM2]MBT1450025.1 Holliday junction branch migration protein RuvA [Glaciecola sp. XM2]
MIGSLRGTITEKLPPDILLDVNGVGYEIQLPMTSFYQLPDVGAQVSLFTHFVVREDAQLLFGFIERSERSLFRVLIKANGVGPKLACTILSGMSASQFIHSVMHEDITALVKMPGVGKKTAERLVVELKDKLNDIDAPMSAAQLSAPVSDQTQAPVLMPTASAKDEAISALVALGYKRVQAEQSIKAIFNEDASSEQLIRDALKSMV